MRPAVSRTSSSSSREKSATRVKWRPSACPEGRAPRGSYCCGELTLQRLGFIMAPESIRIRRYVHGYAGSLGFFRELAALQNDMGRLSEHVPRTGTGQRRERRALVDPRRRRVGTTSSSTPSTSGLPRTRSPSRYDDGALTVSGKRERTEQSEDDRFYRYERRFGSFSRTVGLPQGVEEDAIRADYRDGVLEIHVPKPEAPKPRGSRSAPASRRRSRAPRSGSNRPSGRVLGSAPDTAFLSYVRRAARGGGRGRRTCGS